MSWRKSLPGKVFDDDTAGNRRPDADQGRPIMSGAPAVLDMKSILSDRSTRVVVCCGAGGVGKTTTAAAMALRAAEYGRHVVVLTIDPAKRLAQALGIRELGNEPQRVPLGE
jgi:Mrp family chromosome partitioning ATPase